MPKLDLQLSPPANEIQFEQFCLMLFQAAWGDSTAQTNGRRGQRQAGVDIFGNNHAQDGKRWGVQCKCKNTLLGRQLSIAEVDAELSKADGFTPPLGN